jgi:hypothetical protein
MQQSAKLASGVGYGLFAIVSPELPVACSHHNADLSAQRDFVRWYNKRQACNAGSIVVEALARLFAVEAGVDHAP